MTPTQIDVSHLEANGQMRALDFGNLKCTEHVVNGKTTFWWFDANIRSSAGPFNSLWDAMTNWREVSKIMYPLANKNVPPALPKPPGKVIKVDFTTKKRV
jgi:hypothetical protein